MSGWDDDLVDPFLASVEETAEGDVSPLVEALGASAEAPSSKLKQRILGELSLTGRFDRFVDRVAELLDTDTGHAKGLLDRIHEDDAWHVGLIPDIHLYDVDGGPTVENAITGFVRMTQGTPFPLHEHIGVELALVIQGSAVDSHGSVWQVGDVVEMKPGSDHSFEARPGPDLLFLTVVQQGLKIGGREFGPDDPNI